VIIEWIYLNGIGTTTDAMPASITFLSLGYDRFVLDHLKIIQWYSSRVDHEGRG